MADLCKYFKIRSWEKYQSFNKDRPNWIKLHASLLDDYEYCTLPDTNKILFIHLCILAGQLKNKIPADKKWLRQKLSLKRINLAGLFESGFLEWCNDGVTDVKQPLHSRDREEKETEGERAHAREAGKQPPKTILENFQPTAQMIEEVKSKYGFSDSTIEIETGKFVEHHRAKGRSPAGPVGAWHLWMTRQWEFVGGPEKERKKREAEERELNERINRQVEDAWAEANACDPEEALAAIQQVKQTLRPPPDDEVVI